MTRLYLIAAGLVGLLLAVIGVVLVTAEGKPKVPCVGTVTKLYSEYNPGVNINVGGTNGQGGIGIPVGNGTKYYFAVQRTDGTVCSRHVSKALWLTTEQGATTQ